MSNYSEKQLLMLTQFVYLNCSVSDESIETIINKYRDEKGNFTKESVSKIGGGGGMDDEGVAKLLDEMDKEILANPSFGKLSATRKLNEGQVIRAICYTDEKDANPVIAIRGTGGTKEAWTDNVMGGYETDTQLQKLTADFVKNECAMYSNITVTGHSKGGNLSQYVTVMCPEMVERCISFDGQGFCKDFIEDNKQLIEEASPKIKSISAYNDFVNILLTSIAGSCVYVANEKGIINAHSGLSMLLNNDYDEAGNIESYTNQSDIAKGLKRITDTLVTLIEPLDTKDKANLSNITGTTLATAFGVTSENVIATTSGALYANIVCSFVDEFLDKKRYDAYDIPLGTKYIYFDQLGVNRSLFLIKENKADILLLKERIRNIENDMSKTISSWLYVERRLNKIVKDMDSLSENMDSLLNTIENIKMRYVEKERTLTILMGS